MTVMARSAITTTKTPINYHIPVLGTCYPAFVILSIKLHLGLIILILQMGTEIQKGSLFWPRSQAGKTYSREL